MTLCITNFCKLNTSSVTKTRTQSSGSNSDTGAGRADRAPSLTTQHSGTGPAQPSLPLRAETQPKPPRSHL